jgi:hypothetical protein
MNEIANTPTQEPVWERLLNRLSVLTNNFEDDSTRIVDQVRSINGFEFSPQTDPGKSIEPSEENYVSRMMTLLERLEDVDAKNQDIKRNLDTITGV